MDFITPPRSKAGVNWGNTTKRNRLEVSEYSGIGLSANIETQKMEKPARGGFKLCDEVTTLNSITNFLRRKPLNDICENATEYWKHHYNT